MHKRKISVQRPKSKPRKPVCNSCSDRNALLEVSVYLPKEQRELSACGTSCAIADLYAPR